MNRGGRKSYANIVEPQKKFQPRVEQDCRGFFFHLKAIYQLPSTAVAPRSPLIMLLYRVLWSEVCCRESHQGLSPQLRAWRERGYRAAEMILCLCSLPRGTGGEEGGSSWGPPASSLPGCFNAMLASGGLNSRRTDGEFGMHKCGFNLVHPSWLSCAKCFWGTIAASFYCLPSSR